MPFNETQPSIKIHGLPYQSMASLLPEENKNCSFIQIHILDKESQLKERESYKAEVDIKAQASYIRKIMTDFIFENNILSKSFRLGFEIIKDRPDYKLVFGNANPDKKNYIIPEVKEIAGIYNDRQLKFVKNAIVINSRRGEPWKRISFYSKFYEPLGYPLLFLYGQNG